MITVDEFNVHHVFGDPPNFFESFGFNKIVLVGEGNFGCFEEVLHLNILILSLLFKLFIWLDNHLLSCIPKKLPFIFISYSLSSLSNSAKILVM